MRWVVPVFGLNPKTCGQMAGFHSGHMASPNVRRRAHRCRCRASVQGVWHPPKWRPPRRSSPPRNACTAGGGLRWRRFRKFRAPGRPRPQDSGPGRFYDRELTWQVGESKVTETSAFQLAPTGTLPTLMGGTRDCTCSEGPPRARRDRPVTTPICRRWSLGGLR